MTPPPSVDSYLAGLPLAQREALSRVRARIRGMVPDAEETISYGMPAFRVGGRGLLWFAGWTSHLALYPLTDAFVSANEGDLAGFRRTKGSLHFTPERPLPDRLLERLVHARLADLAARRR